MGGCSFSILLFPPHLEAVGAAHRALAIDTPVSVPAIDSETDFGSALANSPAALRVLCVLLRYYDSIVAMNLLEHLDDLTSFIREVTRVLKPGGVFAFHTINRTWYAHARMSTQHSQVHTCKSG